MRKGLYHPKRLLGFEAYVEPTGFDRHTQPVDIYDVFEKYYRNHRTAKYIYSVSDSFLNNYAPWGSEIGDMPVELRTNDELYNMSWLYSYELSGIRYYFNTPHTTYSTAIKGDYTSIEVASTVGYPNSGKISLGLYSGLAYGGITDYSCFFKYDSKDDTHFYWSGSPQRVWGYEYGAYGKIVRPVIAWQGTKRYVIVSNTNMMSQACNVASYIQGPEWLYCGNLIYTIFTSGGAAGDTCSIKYIHIDKLNNITLYHYGNHRNSLLTGNLYISHTPSEIGYYDINSGPFEYGNTFVGCTLLTGTLNIPANITRINNCSFQSCTGLTTLILNEGLERIQNYAFYGCTGFTTGSENTGSLIIPETVDYIGFQAFFNCNKFTALDLNSHVQTIGEYCFEACTGMTEELTIPASVTAIGTGAFRLTMFTSIVESSVNFVVDKTGGDTDVLYDITDTTYKANYSARGHAGTLIFRTDTYEILDTCSDRNTLKTGTLTIPDTVTRIGDYAFYGNVGFNNLTFDILPAPSLTYIGINAFNACTGFSNALIIPNSVITIKEGAFYNCNQFISLTLGTSVQTIEYYAFQLCTGMNGTTLTLPDSIVTIGGVIYNNAGAFGDIQFIGNLNIPANVATINENAFYLSNFSTITVDPLNTKFYVYEYDSGGGVMVSTHVLYDKSTPGKVIALLSARAFVGDLVLDPTTTKIGTGSFRWNVNRTGTLTLTPSITIIGARSFVGCTGFTTFGGFPASVTDIGEYHGESFDGCTGFTGTLTIPDTVITMPGYYHFNGCSGFTQLKIGISNSGLSNLPYCCFYAMNGLTRVDIYRTIAPAANDYAFGTWGAAKPLHVSSGASGYDIMPWINETIFVQPIVEDL